MYTIAVLPGDGIGQEVTPEALKILQVVGKGSGVGFEFEQGLVGGAAIDETGDPLPDATFRLCEVSRAILLGQSAAPNGTTCRTRGGPSAACSGSGRSSTCSRTSGRSSASRCWWTPPPCRAPPSEARSSWSSGS